MDTGSHLLLGVSLAGLAYADPAVALHPEIAHAVMLGTVIGSVAPDFDTVVRLRGYAFYIRHHRGISHSLPALVVWPTVIAGAIVLASGLAHGWFSLFLWTLAAVVLHVGLDMCNSYGVQSLRPFTKAWVHLDILHIFEPFLFLLHLTGVLAWWLHAEVAPGVLFGWIYAMTGLYIALRAVQHGALMRLLKAQSGEAGLCHIFPQLSWFRWHYVLEGERSFYTGMIERRRVIGGEVFSKQEKNDVIQATVGTDGVRAFLTFAQRVHVTCMEMQDGYHVRWSDVRFWHGQKLPFGVDVRLDRELNVISCSLGWRKKAWEPPFV